MFIIEISYNVLYVWHCMELYDKKFFIYGNCMIRSFGHPGYSPLKCCVSEAGMDTLDLVIVAGILASERMCVPCGAPQCARQSPQFVKKSVFKHMN